MLRGTDTEPWRPTRRLPLAVTSLEGRIETLHQIITSAEVRRLLTLIGPGGVGKTRLLIETGHRLQASHPDRPVVMCELAGANEESAVDVVAAALTIDRRAGEGLAERLAAVLADTAMVLLIDNCEHVLDPIADLVDRLLVACPNVWVIATSRERFRVAGEQLYEVPPLPTSDDEGPAVRLFVERARAVMPQFDPDAAERASIVESSGVSTGCRWRSSWRRRACARSMWMRWRRGWTAVSSCFQQEHARRASWFVGGGGVVVVRDAR